MDRIVTTDPEGALRRRLSDFITRSSPWHHSVNALLKKVRAHKWKVFVFGGALRDLVTISPTVAPRDLDLVVAGATSEDLQAAFATELIRVNRFGGLNLLIHKLPVDIWTLESTWAFRHGRVSGGDFMDLPKTTFLNVEAIAAELDTQPGRARQVYGRTFFRSIQERLLEINLEENPFPGLCVVRSLVIARKLNFAIGPRLIRFIAHHGSRMDVEEFEAMQLTHYGRIRINRPELQQALRTVREKSRSVKLRPVELPKAKQLDWDFGRWPYSTESQTLQLDWHSRWWEHQSFANDHSSSQ